MRMDEKMLFERIIELLKDDDWKEQICGMTIFSGSTGMNFYKNWKLLSLSITEEEDMIYPDEDELKKMFVEV